MCISERIKKRRREKNLTQQELAELVGISPMTERRWEWSERVPRVDELIKLAEVLNTTTDYLLKGEPFEPEPQAHGTGQNLPINNAPETVNNQNENLGLGYWGSVADNARKVAARGDKQDSAIVVALLRKALNSFEGENADTPTQIIGVNGNNNNFRDVNM